MKRAWYMILQKQVCEFPDLSGFSFGQESLVPQPCDEENHFTCH
jgi:hypothetical protein